MSNNLPKVINFEDHGSCFYQVIPNHSILSKGEYAYNRKSNSTYLVTSDYYTLCEGEFCVKPTHFAVYGKPVPLYKDGPYWVRGKANSRLALGMLANNFQGKGSACWLFIGMRESYPFDSYEVVEPIQPPKDLNE